MAINTSPIFISRGNILPARITGSNIASDGSGTLFPVVTAVADGTRVDGIRFRNSQLTAAASSAMVHRIFLSNTSGSSYRLIGEIATAAATRSTTVIGATSIFTFDQPIIMLSGQVMAVCQSVFGGSSQDLFDACAFAGDYTG
jgi:hypothetical protein